MQESEEHKKPKYLLLPRKYYEALKGTTISPEYVPMKDRFEAIPIEERLRRRLTITTANELFERRTGKTLKADAEQRIADAAQRLAAAKAAQPKRPKGFAPQTQTAEILMTKEELDALEKCGLIKYEKRES